MNIASRIKKISHRFLITAITFAVLFAAGSLIARSPRVHASKTACIPLGDDSVQFTGYPVVGSRVYYFLDSGPNMGKARPAIVLRAHQSDSGPGQTVDLVVFETPDDVTPQVMLARKNPSNAETILFAQRSPGVHQPGSWDWMIPSSTGE